MSESELIRLDQGKPNAEQLQAADDLFQVAHVQLLQACRDDAALAKLMTGQYFYKEHKPGGFLPLRELLAWRHGVLPKQVYVTDRALLAHEAVAKYFKGHRFGFFAPTYFRFPAIYADEGKMFSTSLPMDGKVNLPAFDEFLESNKIDVFVCTPFGQNPLGCDIINLHGMLAVCRERGVHVVLDLAYQEFALDPMYLEPPKLTGSVILIGTFAKTLVPGTSLWGGNQGYVIFPENDRFPQETVDLGLFPFVSTNYPLQWKILQLLKTNAYAPHLSQVQFQYTRAIEVLHDKLSAELGDAIGLPPKDHLKFFLGLRIPATSFEQIEHQFADQLLQVRQMSDAFLTPDDYRRDAEQLGHIVRLGVHEVPMHLIQDIGDSIVQAIRFIL